jgi:serine/threonine protein kinase
MNMNSSANSSYLGSSGCTGWAPAGNGLALLMEDAGETNLAALIRSRRLSIADFLNIAVQLADAVARLHVVRIIHRDIHPGNIVWNSESEIATLCDFAIAPGLCQLWPWKAPIPSSSKELSPTCRQSRPAARVGQWIGERISTR